MKHTTKTSPDLKDVLAYWNNPAVESMYDKNLLTAEVALILKYLPVKNELKILEAGCGEGEATWAYASVEGSRIDAVDFSPVRLRKATGHLLGRANVTLKEVNFLGPYELSHDYDAIICQRLLINLGTWENQKKVLADFMGLLKPGGKLLLLEGSKQGAAALNELRTLFGLDPIPVRWHNLFIDDLKLKEFMSTQNCRLAAEDGLGAYFLLTRGIRPIFDTDLNWDSPFNEMAAREETKNILAETLKFSRLKFWVFEK